MALTLRSDNRILTSNQKFAYTTENAISGVAKIVVSNLEPFEVGDPILIGEIGKADAEILKVNAIDTNTREITLGDIDNAPINSSYSHPESTKVTVLPYDQIRFYWTAATGTIQDENPIFDENNPLTFWESFDPSAWYSTFVDYVHASGFGWFVFKNKTTAELSQESNPVPYSGFSGNTAAQVFQDFDSLLNTNELRLVTMNDKFSWLNEALVMFYNRLNLTNPEFTVTTPNTITTTAGVAEYLLPNNFTDMTEIINPYTGKSISFLPVHDVMENNGSFPQELRYYLRGRYVGFSPTPTETGINISYTYKTKSTRITDLSVLIQLPDNGEICLKSWMMYRAYLKFNNPLAATYLQDWNNGLNLILQSSVKRNSDLETWGIASNANA